MATKKDSINVHDLLSEAKQLLESTKKKICRDCKKIKILVQSGRCEDCQRAKMEAAEERRKTTKLEHKTNGAILVYDENDRLVYEHRRIMEIHLGRPLTKNEVVFHRDGDRKNNDFANLILGIKHGIPLESLKCSHCDSVGTIEIPTD